MVSMSEDLYDTDDEEPPRLLGIKLPPRKLRDAKVPTLPRMHAFTAKIPLLWVCRVLPQ